MPNKVAFNAVMPTPAATMRHSPAFDIVAAMPVETVAEWLEADDGSVGACLLCGGRYYSQADYDYHRCRHD
jgi:hypothetical protein